LKEVLLTINDVYWLLGATIYLGVLTTLRLFLYPSWTSLRPETTRDHFTVPTEAATRFFLRAIPTWILVAIVSWWGIQPINREIKAGVRDEEHLRALLRKWMKINDLRWAAVIVMWGTLCWYFVQKPDLPGALG
jgi:hypothetical protein